MVRKHYFFKLKCSRQKTVQLLICIHSVMFYGFYFYCKIAKILCLFLHKCLSLWETLSPTLLGYF